MNEQEAITRVLNGDQSAFSALVQLYQAPVYNLCYRMLGQPDQAEDAAQETFLRVFTQLGRYDAARSFKTWILSIASHHCIDRLRRRRITWVDIDDEPLAGHPALRERRAGPEEVAVRSEREAAVRELLAALPEKDRAALILLYWHDMSYEEIAEATGATVSAIKSRLHRARLAMGAMMNTRPSTLPSGPAPRISLALG